MKATLQKLLVLYDGPQVVLLQTEGRVRHKIIAIAVDHDDYNYGFFACIVTKRSWSKYISGQADLYYLFKKAALRNYFMFDWCDIDEENYVDIRKANIEEIRNPEYWPERGFFSTYHTEEYEESSDELTTQAFHINGKWEPIDFSSFYNKLSDVYGILYALQDQVQDPDPGQENSQSLSTNILTKIWRGGGSYTGFYKSLKEAEFGMPLLNVNRIQYASPGTIEIDGSREIFEQFSDTLLEYKEGKDRYNDAASKINSVLKKEKLKTAAPNTPFSSEPQEKFVKLQSDIFLRIIGEDSKRELFIACGSNTLVYAKVALSLHRRVSALQNFIEEGRVNISDLEEDSPADVPDLIDVNKME